MEGEESERKIERMEIGGRKGRWGKRERRIGRKGR